MVVAGVVHAVPGEEIEDAAPASSAELHSGTPLVGNVHGQDVEPPLPWRIHVLRIQRLRNNWC